MDLLPTEEQDEIITTVRSQLERNFDLHALAQLDGASSVVDSSLWKQCAELGWFGLGLPEALGGVGYTLAEEALLFAEIGSHAAPGPFLATVLAGRVAALLGESELSAQILAGEQLVALAEPHGDSDAVAGANVSGTFRVTDFGGADLVLVLVGTSASIVAATDLVAEPMASLDRLVPTAIGTVSQIPAICFQDDASAVQLRATVLIAAELAGIATATAEQSTQYAKDRVQFGTPVGSFQAVKHRCADMAVLADAANSLVRYAAIAVLDGLPDAAFHAHAARVVATRAAIENSQINVQNHGGIGFTLEHTAHRFVTRAQVRSRTVGDLRSHLGGLLEQPAAL
ncbi:MAG: acyl-CoA dehydrogenase family protein [Microthrixaceae bacterium]